MARDTPELTDAQWERLAPLLPPQKLPMGRPYLPHRRIVEAIMWLARTGAPWRDLPERYGPWQTVASRFYAWRRQGVGARVLAGLQTQADGRGEVDWLLHLVDGSVVRAHQHAAGARHQPATPDRGAPQYPDEALGRRRGGLSTKLHLRTEGGGKPIAIVLTAGQAHEAPVLPRLLDAGAVRRPGPDGRPGRGRPRLRPKRIAGDKGYSYPSARARLRRRGIGVVIPTRSDQRRNPRFDKVAYAERNRVERCVNRLKGFRRVATRYEKRGVNYEAMVVIAAIVVLWL